MVSGVLAVFHKFENGNLTNIGLWKNPFTDSLYRLKQKLLFNHVQNSYFNTPGFNNYFITLTISPEYYDVLTKQNAFSAVMRKYMTRLRNWINRGSTRGKLKRLPGQCEYAYRIEAGSKRTQRYHLHMILTTDLKKSLIYRYIRKSWKFADWNKLYASRSKFKKSMQKLDNSNLAHIYITKYITKKRSSTAMRSFQRTRSEHNCRLFNTSRFYEKIPSHLKMKYDPEMKAWAAQVKDGYFPVKDESDEDKTYYIKSIIYEKLWLKSFRNIPNVNEAFNEIVNDKKLMLPKCPGLNAWILQSLEKLAKTSSVVADYKPKKFRHEFSAPGKLYPCLGKFYVPYEHHYNNKLPFLREKSKQKVLNIEKANREFQQSLCSPGPILNRKGIDIFSTTYKV